MKRFDYGWDVKIDKYVFVCCLMRVFFVCLRMYVGAKFKSLGSLCVLTGPGVCLCVLTWMGCVFVCAHVGGLLLEQ